MRFAKLALRAGFITVFTMCSVRAAGVSAAYLLPLDLVQQLVTAVLIFLLLELFVLPNIAERLFISETPHLFKRYAFGASCFASALFVTIGCFLLIYSGFSTPLEALLIGLAGHFLISLFIAARWLLP